MAAAATVICDSIISMKTAGGSVMWQKWRCSRRLRCIRTWMQRCRGRVWTTSEAQRGMGVNDELQLYR